MRRSDSDGVFPRGNVRSPQVSVAINPSLMGRIFLRYDSNTKRSGCAWDHKMIISRHVIPLASDRINRCSHNHAVKASSWCNWSSCGTVGAHSIGSCSVGMKNFVRSIIVFNSQGHLASSTHRNDNRVGLSIDRKSTRLNSSHSQQSRMPSSA